MRSPLLLTCAAVLVLAGCSTSPDGHEPSEGSPSTEAAPPEPPPDAPPAPDVDELADDGFDCRELPAHHPDEVPGQTHMLCLYTADEVAVTIDAVILGGSVLKWTYMSTSFDFGREPDRDDHRPVLTAAFEAFAPSDAGLVDPMLETWSVRGDGEHWVYDGSGHAGLGGSGFLAFDAIDEDMVMTVSERPDPASFPVDLKAFTEATVPKKPDGLDCRHSPAESYMGETMNCMFGDVSLRIGAGINGDFEAFGLALYTDSYDQVAEQLTSLAALSGSADVEAYVAAVIEASRDDGPPRLTWIHDVPTFIVPMDHADGWRVEAELLFDGLD